MARSYIEEIVIVNILSPSSFLPPSLPPSLPDCELIALLEDDTGMELLVCNKIISLDLPVKEVYKKIWCAQPNVSHWSSCPELSLIP